ncbi:MAG: phosphate ABC transporter permease subunit PstC [Pirellulaceae bacterium]
MSSETPRKFVRLRNRKAASSTGRVLREIRERIAHVSLGTAAFSSILITAAIVIVLLYESSSFFGSEIVPEDLQTRYQELKDLKGADKLSAADRQELQQITDQITHVSLWEFFTSTQWAPLFDPPKHGILPLVTATIMTTVIALTVALPIGTIAAVYLSEFAHAAFRETIKPSLELLSAVPTVIYGYFALTVVSPVLQWIMPDLPRANMLSAGIVMGLMIIPYVSSLSEDAMRSVPMLLREGSMALGANKFITAFRVVIPSALSGIGAAYILGISRAIGETMVVAIAAGMQPRFTFNPTEQAQTITSYIVATSQGETPHGTVGYQSIFAAGLVLFCMTLIFNILGYWLRRRYHQAY